MIRADALAAVSNTITALATAGMCLLSGRDHYPPQAQELVTALREDIANMIGDVEALQDVIAGK